MILKIDNNDINRRLLEQEIKSLESAAGDVEKPTLPSVKLQEMTYTAPSDEELQALAEQALGEDVETLKTESANSEKELRGKLATYETGLNKTLSDLEGDYRTASANIDNDVIKRGLARSSIAVGAKGELEGEYMLRAAEARALYGKEITALESEISAVSQKLQTALNDFNLSYAAKLNKKLSELKSECAKKAEEALKYNNTVRAQQAELDIDRATAESKLYSEALSQKKQAADIGMLSESEREAIYKEVYDKLDKYLSDMSSVDAKLELRNHSLYRDHLSDKYFYMLYDRYGR